MAMILIGGAVRGQQTSLKIYVIDPNILKSQVFQFGYLLLHSGAEITLTKHALATFLELGPFLRGMLWGGGGFKYGWLVFLRSRTPQNGGVPLVSLYKPPKKKGVTNSKKRHTHRLNRPVQTTSRCQLPGSVI